MATSSLTKNFEVKDPKVWNRLMKDIGGYENVNTMEFINWLIDSLFDEDISDGCICELACRKLYEMGLIEKDKNGWVKLD